MSSPQLFNSEHNKIKCIFDNNLKLSWHNILSRKCLNDQQQVTQLKTLNGWQLVFFSKNKSLQTKIKIEYFCTNKELLYSINTEADQR